MKILHVKNNLLIFFRMKQSILTCKQNFIVMLEISKHSRTKIINLKYKAKRRNIDDLLNFLIQHLYYIFKY